MVLPIKPPKSVFEEYDEAAKVAEKMILYGGGFVSNLGEALIRADLNNIKKIKKAFPEYWEKYAKQTKTE